MGFLRKLPKFNKFFFSLISVKDGKQNWYLSLSALHVSLIFGGAKIIKNSKQRMSDVLVCFPADG